MSGSPPKHLARYASRWLIEELKSNAKVGNWEAAIATLQQIRESSLVELNVFHYSSAIAACSSAGQLQPAMDLLREMKSKGVAPNVYTYTSLVTACGKNGEVDTALKLFAEMRLSNILPNVQALTALITTCAHGGAWERGIKILHSAIPTFSIPPNVRTYTAAMEGCRRAGVCTPAQRLLDEMNDPYHVLPNEVTYHTALGCCCPPGETPPPPHRQNRDHKMETSTASSSSHAEEIRTEAAQRIFARMVASGYYPVPYTRTLLGNIFKGTPFEGMEENMPVLFNREKNRQESRPDVDPATAHELEDTESSHGEPEK